VWVFRSLHFSTEGVIRRYRTMFSNSPSQGHSRPLTEVAAQRGASAASAGGRGQVARLARLPSTSSPSDGRQRLCAYGICLARDHDLHWSGRGALPTVATGLAKATTHPLFLAILAALPAALRASRC